MKMNRQPE